MKKKYRFFDPFTGEAPLKCTDRALEMLEGVANAGDICDEIT